MKAVLDNIITHRIAHFGEFGFGHQLMSEVQKVHLLRIFVQKNKREYVWQMNGWGKPSKKLN